MEYPVVFYFYKHKSASFEVNQIISICPDLLKHGHNIVIQSSGLGEAKQLIIEAIRDVNNLLTLDDENCILPSDMLSALNYVSNELSEVKIKNFSDISLPNKIHVEMIDC